MKIEFPKSTYLQSALYDPIAAVLSVQDRYGQWVHHLDVDKDVVDSLSTALSAGEFYKDEIQQCYLIGDRQT